MQKPKFAAVLTAAALSLGFVGASAQTVSMMLEYDGSLHSYTGSVYELEVNGSKVTSAMEPIIFNDRALVPVREVCEALGAAVEYEDQQIELFMGSNYIRLRINDNVVYVNGRKELIPDNVVPKLISKPGGETKTMVPVRFISETLGFNVDFLGDEGLISITSDNYVQQTAAPTVEPTAEPTAAPTAAPTAEPTVAPTAAPTIEPTAAPANTVTGIWYTKLNNYETRINISASGAFPEYSDFTLSDPDRIVLDLDDCTRDAAVSDTYSINSGCVDAVRVGDHDGTLRIVLDLNAFESYKISRSGDSRILYIDVAGEAVSPSAPTAQPTQKPSDSTSSSTQTTPVPDGTKLIVLDAGHGGKDGGAQGTLNGKTIYEKDLTLSIMTKTQAVLEKNGYTVQVTRSGDTYPELSERAQLANDLGAAAFISIHINAVDNAPSASGTEVYFSELNNSHTFNLTSKQMAENILEEMIDAMGTKNRGVKTANHVVTRSCNMPAVLVEVGFISNEEELRKMCDDSFQNTVAESIAAGIMKSVDDIVMPE